MANGMQYRDSVITVHNIKRCKQFTCNDNQINYHIHEPLLLYKSKSK